VPVSVIAIALDGWAAKPPASVATDPREDAALFELFIARDEGLVDLWRQHEPYLRALAHAWRLTPAWYVRPRTASGLRFIGQEPGDGHAGPFYFSEALAEAAR
jgi:hypothetical protein